MNSTANRRGFDEGRVGGSMKGRSGALTGKDELDSDSFCWLRAS